MADVELRAFRIEDAPAVHRWFHTWEAVRSLVEYRESMSMDQAEAWVRRAMDCAGADRKWAIWPAGAPHPVGFTALYGVGRQTAPELGILVGEPAFWRRGVGTEAMRQTLAFAFETLRAHRVYLRVLATNAAARHVYEGLGFVYEGTLRSHVRRGQEMLDVEVYGIIRKEWEFRAVPKDGTAAVSGA